MHNYVFTQRCCVQESLPPRVEHRVQESASRLRSKFPILQLLEAYGLAPLLYSIARLSAKSQGSTLYSDVSIYTTTRQGKERDVTQAGKWRSTERRPGLHSIPMSKHVHVDQQRRAREQ